MAGTIVAAMAILEEEKSRPTWEDVYAGDDSFDSYDDSREKSAFCVSSRLDLAYSGPFSDA